MKRPDFQLATIVSQPFEQNTYVARLADRGDCVIVDPGLEPEKIVAPPGTRRGLFQRPSLTRTATATILGVMRP